jgi:cysteine desulfurase
MHRTVAPGVDVLPGHLHLCVRGIEREELLLALSERGVCASGGSSCASGALEASYVLAAMGVPDELARGAIRFTLGHDTTEADVDRALVVVPEVVASLRRPS